MKKHKTPIPAYTPPWMTPELEMLRESVKKFFHAEFLPHEERWCKNGMIDRDAWLKAGELGLLCASVPEEYGGAGGSLAHDAVIFGEQARALVTSFGNIPHSGIVAQYLISYGTEEQKNHYLPKMISGEMIGSIAMSEPDAGSDLQSIRSRAELDGDHYRINGSKIFITNGFHADLLCMAVKTSDEAGYKGISMILVETKDLKGFKRGRLLDKMGYKGTDTAELFFGDVLVPKQNILGGIEGQGFYQMMGQLPQERLYIAINFQAQMEKAIEITLEYVENRLVFGQKLSELQNTRFKLAECVTEMKLARLFLDHCIVSYLSGSFDTSTSAMAKWWITQKAYEVVDTCLQLHGGNGYILDYPIAKMFQNVRVGRIYGGSNEIMKEIIARSILS
jgi:acyl-CoA dehydrogenase